MTDVLNRLADFDKAIRAMGRQMDHLWTRQSGVADLLRSSPDKSHSSVADARGNWEDVPVEVIRQIPDQIGQRLVADGRVKAELADPDCQATRAPDLSRQRAGLSTPRPETWTRPIRPPQRARPVISRQNKYSDRFQIGKRETPRF